MHFPTGDAGGGKGLWVSAFAGMTFAARDRNNRPSALALTRGVSGW